MGFWSWFSLITGTIGVVAFLMAVQPFVKMIWGRPKLKVEFSTYDVPAGSCMICEIWNEPITRGFLNFLRISRDPAQDVIAFFTIKERGSGKIIPKKRNASPIKTQSGTRAERISIAPSVFPSSFIVAIVNKGKGYVMLEDEVDMLPVGEYVVDVKIENEGKQIFSKSILIIGNDYPFAHWSPN